jgi:UDPglucose--hexose-1-phosphate uridylyltransferase
LKVVMAPERATRPFSLASSTPSAASAAGDKASRAAECPLCEGHEDWTPPETFAVRPNGGPPDSPGWLVRAVPNKYPVLAAIDDSAPDGSGRTPPHPEQKSAEANLVRPERGSGDSDLFASAPASGAHEVIIHAPAHVDSIAELSPQQVAIAVDGWKARLAANADAAYTHLIVNEGLIAGASLEHSHAQLYGLQFVPALIAREREHFTAHNMRTMGGCLLCDLLQEEVRRRERVIAINEQAVLLAPYASRMPYELQLVPRAHAPSFAGSPGDADSSAAIAALLRDGLVRLKDALGGPPPLNLWLRTAPRHAPHFHWHIDIVPRLTQLAGLELGAGVAVDIYTPERVAAELRSAGDA